MIELGLMPQNPLTWPQASRWAGYGRDPDGYSFREALDFYLIRKSLPFLAGDVALVAFRGEPERHVGIVTDATHGRMYWVEAESYRFKQVRETRLVLTASGMRLTQAYRIPGIDA